MKLNSKEIKWNNQIAKLFDNQGKVLCEILTEKTIGKGSSSNVLLGKVLDNNCTELSRVDLFRDKIAIKVLTNPDNLSFKERFVREGEILCRISHPNIVKGLAFGEISFGNENTAFPATILEYVQGDNLLDIIQAYRTDLESLPPPKHSLKIILGISCALSYLYLDGRVQAHRDIKPSNILLSKNNIPKLIDLGIAKTSMRASCDLETKLAGTIRYMSPEQIVDSSTIDVRSDIYSLGIVLLELLGLDIISSKDPKQLLAKRLQSDFPNFQSLSSLPAIKDEQQMKMITKLLQKMCAFEAYDRFQTPMELSQTIEKILKRLVNISSSQSTIEHKYRAQTTTRDANYSKQKVDMLSASNLKTHKLRRNFSTRSLKIFKRINVKAAVISTAVFVLCIIGVIALLQTQPALTVQHLETPPQGKDIVLSVPAY